ncbi:potassium-transporting ATPase A subunit domain protein [Leptospira interrogans serovar Grippotyphosa str. LT2186]|uniref:Potassium-transporting ATPase A subunit domain protein n=2 Tax=Leptospira interrogans TaxID=173 RepID=M3G091_LEPIR|nr:potassium-transporting ATPase A subunit domain protein [Leptospira interrogans serovar Grippotyphosa str. LT2186]EMP06309.1 potassium-transporting ATPase A subunit domain protein [Leptospira interrogans serovar Pyrogenes str. 200701872]
MFLILFFQNYLPLNPENFPGLVWDLAFNTAVSFTTNTNWQAYSGESTLSFFPKWQD